MWLCLCISNVLFAADLINLDQSIPDEFFSKLLAYLEETRKFVQDYFAAAKTICFDWRVRLNPKLLNLIIVRHRLKSERLQFRKVSEDSGSLSGGDVLLTRTTPIPPAYKAHAGMALNSYSSKHFLTN